MGKVWLKCIIEIFFGQMFLRTCAKHQTFKNINNLYRGLDTYIQLLMTVCIFRIVDMGLAMCIDTKYKMQSLPYFF